MFYWTICVEGVEIMVNAFLFMLGFTGVVSVYEIAKTGKKTKSDKLERTINTYRKTLK